MRKKLTQIAPLLIILSMLLTMFAGCADSVGETDSGESAAETEVVETSSESVSQPEESESESGTEAEKENSAGTDETEPAGEEETVLLVGNADYTGVSFEHQLNKDTIYSKEQMKNLEKFGLSRISNVWVKADKLYIEGETDNDRHILVSCNPDFSDADIVDEFYLTSSDEFSCAVSDSGAVYVMQTTQHNRLSADRYWVRKLSRREDKNNLWSIVLETEWVYGIYCVGERAVVFASDGLWIYNEDGELESHIKPWEDAEMTYSYSMAVLDENRLLLIGGGAYGDYLREINLDTGELVDYERPFWWESEYHCQKGCGYDVFITMESCVVGYNLGDDGYTEVIDCAASRVPDPYDSIYAYSIYSLGDGRFISVNEGDSGRNMYVMEKAAPETVGNRIVVTIGGYYMVRKVEGPGYGQIQSAVETFNESSDIYYVKIDEKYFDYGGFDGWRENKREALIDAVKNGTAPDIVLWEDGSLSLTSGIEAFMEDLYPWIDRDAELSRGDFYENLLEAYSVDGKLCQITPSVEIETIAGRRSVLGDRESWNIGDLEELLKEYPELVPGSSSSEYYLNWAKMGYLSRMVRLAGEQFISLESESCSFDSEEFVRWLKLCGGETVQRVEPAVNSGENAGMTAEEEMRIFESVTISWLSSYQYTENKFGEEIVFVGAPGPENYHSVVTGILPMGIYAESEVKDGAWEFVRYILSKEYQDGAQWSLPIRKDCMAERAQTAGIAADAPVMKLIETVDRNEFYTDEMYKIVWTESQKYFSGEVTAEAAAELIQNEMESYLGFAQDDPVKALWVPDGRLQSTAEGIVRRIQMGDEVSVDLDGDGSAEKLAVMVRKSDDGTLMPALRLDGAYYNADKVSAMTGELVNPDSACYYLVDLDTEDAWVEIALAAAGENDYPETAFLRYNEGELFSIGKVTSGPPLTDDGEVKLITAGDGRIIGKSRLDLIEKAWILREWSLTNYADGSAELCEEIAEYYVLYPNRDNEEYLTMIQDMTVYTEMDESSETAVLPAETRVAPYRYYPEGEWIYISCLLREEGWIKLTENGILQPMGIEVEEISEYVSGLR